MGYIYEGMDRAKEGIKSAYEGDESKYRPIWDIIDRRWQTQLHRPLQAAAYYLNPAFHFRLDFKADEEVLSGLYSVIERMSPGHSSSIVQELEAFSNAEGEVFSRLLCKENRTKMQLDRWWQMFGPKTPNLQ
ncbi:uncharacterized protein LOC131062763 [Cryptomeria japonica]|uniref:uncharacterized protein LOC131062763 n=1 Tax=Cryptomeria japonica TaxID=3369 RepID=UPI0027DA0787|nr:uncharacterized protein LOC131062763 [Cryptomeria japonica]